ncbi:MAG: UDP-N-acetylmuramoyl-tripeptide--D-alanyl-D-alanine ligase [Proteobacteria bacterium]|nr:UDP-N-acetylmuramoyl-tripeptide--D-alanyl-D-alanine ligase [Pseudomonadota bacterium]MBU4470893.1 UDP-N-acetylmuramoyl-tripeptide--D-alanyl-D-alanine ligase [Pseudomonadota bacterium]MCG2751891.1 UDP-N-acetylmuramoyl-tripeptide--D-alanyl-D-alanine ligase [Desulfobacteraceae bacterium]
MKKGTVVMMNDFSLTISDILKATGGKLLAQGGEWVFRGISTDSRKILPGDLFVALKGQQHDGHDYVNDILEKGVKGVLVQKDLFSLARMNEINRGDGVCIGVSDSLRALGDIAHFHRKKFDIPVIAITGSNGKTSTKEMTAAILGGKFRVLSTEGNLNNEIGLPQTLFRLDGSHEQVVLELGMNHPGEIQRLGEICEPRIGVITNIGHSHLEGLGSVEAVKKAKGELLKTLKPSGISVLNADDPNVLSLLPEAPGDVVLFGRSQKARIRAAGVISHGRTVSFDLILPDETIPVELPVPGEFMVHNALAAASVGFVLGFSGLEIKKGLEAFKPVKGRMNVLTSPSGVNIVDDTYNANPASVKGAILSLMDLKKKKRGAVCLGDMLELGPQAAELHETLGKLISGMDVERLFLTGIHAEDIAKGALASGMDSDRIVLGTREEILADVIGWMKRGDWILVKGSRSTRMEYFVNHLMGHSPSGANGKNAA